MSFFFFYDETAYRVSQENMYASIQCLVFIFFAISVTFLVHKGADSTAIKWTYLICTSQRMLRVTTKARHWVIGFLFIGQPSWFFFLTGPAILIFFPHLLTSVDQTEAWPKKSLVLCVHWEIACLLRGEHDQDDNNMIMVYGERLSGSNFWTEKHFC